MSVLTKLFVVLVSVLSILLVALVVPFVANTENYKVQLEDEQALRIKAEAAARTIQSEINALQEGEAKRTADLRAQVQELNSQISELSSKLRDAEVAAEGEKARIARMEADLARLTAAEQQHAEFLVAYEKELKVRRESDVEQKTRLIQSADRINELTGQNEQLQQAVRRFREEKQALVEQRDQLEAQIRRLPPELVAGIRGDSSAEPFEPDVLVQGEVTEVQEWSGQTFLQVNVGAQDGVAQNMKFMIHRDDVYLGDLVITLVDERASAGVVKLAQDQIAVGDRIRTGGRF